MFDRFMEPDTAEAALDHIRAIEPPAILNHSVRTFRYAAAAVVYEPVDLDALFIACVFHDAGASATYDGPQRFEVEGADAAANFVGARGWSANRCDAVWEAIALHTSSGIAERRGPITRYTRLGVRADFGTAGVVDPALVEATERELPRLNIERVLADAVVDQALTQPGKAPGGSWPGALCLARRAYPNHCGLNPAF